MSQLPDSAGKNPFRRAESLAELLFWNDLDFVRCAYVTLLGRQPDLPGQAHYVARIRAGHSKYEVLLRLRRSAEAKDHDPGIAGLDRALKRAAWQRRPLVGVISRFLRSDADGQSRSDRALRALMNASALNHSLLQAIGDRLAASLAATGPAGAPCAASLSGLMPVDQFVTSQATGEGQSIDAARTPELDHLRTKSVSTRFIGDVAK